MKKIALLCALLSGIAILAQAQTPPPATDFKPQVGQQGKDVIWVPTPPSLVERMLVLAQTTPNDFVVDLGSGDGRIAIAAAKKFRARSMGIEYNPDMVKLSQRLASEAGVAERAQMVEGDIFAKDFSSATVVTMYLLPDLNLRLRPQLLEMKPGTRLVAHLFSMGDWAPDETSTAEGRTAYLWIVPAKVAGRWKVQVTGEGGPREFTLDMEQSYQKVTGAVNFGAITTTLVTPRLRGDRLVFAITDLDGKLREYSGSLQGAALSGTAMDTAGRSGQRPLRWKAEKLQ